MSEHDLADYVVVGAGSAGSILASRLCAAGASVILLEAGGTDRRPDVALPLGIVTLYATANWKYPTAPEPSRDGKAGAFAGGRIVGGSGSINAMVYARGRRADYDGWARAGATGWSYPEVLPHFKALENWVEGPDDYRGGCGPIAVSWCGHHHEIDDAFIQAAVDAGHRRNPDPNGADQAGVARSQVNQRRGYRSSSGREFLHGLPREQRPRVLTRTTVTRVIVENGRAVGVQVGDRVIRARQEVVLCAGAIGSAALLMNSGIAAGGGVADLPGVGENFHDHLVVTQRWASKVPTINTMGPVRLAKAVRAFRARGEGPLTTTPFEAQLFTEDFQIAVTPASYELNPVSGRAKLKRSDAFTAYTVLMHPQGRGRVRVRGGKPYIEFDRLGRAEDVRKLLEGAELTRDLVESQRAMRGVTGAPLNPFGGDARRWLATAESSIYHAVGTCRMGTDDGAVVGPDLRVRGVDGLRVADASVIPAITSGNTNAPTMMIALRAADLILDRPDLTR
ncbi:GMC family oxidoreductase N-terminal domain-containing protein [Mycobacterium hackensackense]|uniref:GMC family oxidoreductase n=1 Tax=Mycobacterium hackensackense TaxID=228909 RepID=UPI002265E497|nr:GMC family oxidoreductase N-terminal domain-containing protein [Mycobacterium hackensackense]MCV7254332.1 GMC family oxidoreductase N-terminal domain-containing protein [Mycobacterium hackensackense]